MAEDSENLERLQSLFELVEKVPADERERVLEEACDDPELRRRVLSILYGAYLPEPAPVPNSNSLPFGGRIGGYRLLELIGAGGLGTVYLAERMVGTIPHRVALKLLAPHASGPEFLERFHREQHILASLDHPHITRMLDAGVGEVQQPYLAMEYVSGEHVNVYCDAGRLGIEQRVELFLQVCEAISYAHRNLIVHLDLKPSNILVSNDGVVKLLDFGTSKLISKDHLLTITALATPAYASPEQLRSEPVTTACDVYSLGVVLFELLCGKRPTGNSSAALLFERALTDAEPASAEAAVNEEAATLRGASVHRLRQMLGGDLETILNKCLRPRAGDRYASVDALAEDLKRYLAGEPVLARPQTMAYRLGKFVRRHRVSVAASALGLVLLASAIGYAGWRQEQAVREGRRAEQMQTFLYRLLYVANTNYTGKPSFSVPDFLDLGARLVPNYVTDPADLRRAQLGLAESMYENDDTGGAEKVFGEVVRSAQRAGDFNSEAEAEAPAGYIAYEKGNVALGETMTARALELSRRRDATPTVRVWSAVYYVMVRDESGLRTDANLTLLQGAVREAVAAPLPPREIADAYYNLALAYQYRHRYADSEAAFQHALPVYEQDSEAQCDRADVHRGIAVDEEQLGRSTGSLPQYEKAWEESQKCSGAESQKSLTNELYVVEGYLRAGRVAEALSLVGPDLAALRKSGISGPPLNRPLRLLGEAYVDHGDFASADALFRDAIPRGKYAELSQGPEFGLLQMVWAKALNGEGQKPEALIHARDAQRLLAVEGETPGALHNAAQAAELVSELSRK